MPIVIQSPHNPISNRTRQIIQKKFERFDKKYDRVEHCHVVLKKEKDQKQQRFAIEARLVVPGNDLFAREKAENFAIAAEMVCVDLENQINKHKGKLTRKRTKPADAFLAAE
jgi:putative sigma-54 modulation protein